MWLRLECSGIKLLVSVVPFVKHTYLLPFSETACPRTWDGVICWPETSNGTQVSLPCPDYVNGFNLNGKTCRLINVTIFMITLDMLLVYLDAVADILSYIV